MSPIGTAKGGRSARAGARPGGAAGGPSVGGPEGGSPERLVASAPSAQPTEEAPEALRSLLTARRLPTWLAQKLIGPLPPGCSGHQRDELLDADLESLGVYHPLHRRQLILELHEALGQAGPLAAQRTGGFLLPPSGKPASEKQQLPSTDFPPNPRLQTESQPQLLPQTQPQSQPQSEPGSSRPMQSSPQSPPCSPPQSPPPQSQQPLHQQAQSPGALPNPQSPPRSPPRSPPQPQPQSQQPQSVQQPQPHPPETPRQRPATAGARFARRGGSGCGDNVVSSVAWWRKEPTKAGMGSGQHKAGVAPGSAKVMPPSLPRKAPLKRARMQSSGHGTRPRSGRSGTSPVRPRGSFFIPLRPKLNEEILNAPTPPDPAASPASGTTPGGVTPTVPGSPTGEGATMEAEGAGDAADDEASEGHQPDTKQQDQEQQVRMEEKQDDPYIDWEQWLEFRLTPGGPLAMIEVLEAAGGGGSVQSLRCAMEKVEGQGAAFTESLNALVPRRAACVVVSDTLSDGGAASGVEPRVGQVAGPQVGLFAWARRRLGSLAGAEAELSHQVAIARVALDHSKSIVNEPQPPVPPPTPSGAMRDSLMPGHEDGGSVNPLTTPSASRPALQRGVSRSSTRTIPSCPTSSSSSSSASSDDEAAPPAAEPQQKRTPSPGKLKGRRRPAALQGGSKTSPRRSRADSPGGSPMSPVSGRKSVTFRRTFSKASMMRERRPGLRGLAIRGAVDGKDEKKNILDAQRQLVVAETTIRSLLKHSRDLGLEGAVRDTADKVLDELREREDQLYERFLRCVAPVEMELKLVVATANCKELMPRLEAAMMAARLEMGGSSLIGKRALLAAEAEGLCKMTVEDDTSQDGEPAAEEEDLWAAQAKRGSPPWEASYLAATARYMQLRDGGEDLETNVPGHHGHHERRDTWRAKAIVDEFLAKAHLPLDLGLPAKSPREGRRRRRPTSEAGHSPRPSFDGGCSERSGYSSWAASRQGSRMSLGTMASAASGKSSSAD